MFHTKIVGHVAAAANVTTEAALRAYFDEHGVAHDHLSGLQAVPDPKNGGLIFWAMPTAPTLRFDLATVPGIIVLDPHVSPHPVKAAHLAVLSAHSVVATDTPWLAHEKLCASLGLVGSPLDPNA